MIQSLFNLPFDLKIGIVRNINGRRIATQDKDNEINPIGLSDTDSGYIRWDGVVNYTEVEDLGCNSILYNATSRFNLIVGLRNYKPNDIFEQIKKDLSTFDTEIKYKIISTSVNQEQIRIDENIRHELYLIKVVFDRIEKTTDVCEVELNPICE